jgi:hypothetical protein
MCGAPGIGGQKNRSAFTQVSGVDGPDPAEHSDVPTKEVPTKEVPTTDESRARIRA